MNVRLYKVLMHTKIVYNETGKSHPYWTLLENILYTSSIK